MTASAMRRAASTHVSLLPPDTCVSPVLPVYSFSDSLTYGSANARVQWPRCAAAALSRRPPAMSRAQAVRAPADRAGPRPKEGKQPRLPRQICHVLPRCLKIAQTSRVSAASSSDLDRVRLAAEIAHAGRVQARAGSGRRPWASACGKPSSRRTRP
jgi:hypothetical protein